MGTVQARGGLFRRFFALGRLAKRAYGPYKKQLATLTVLGFLGGILEGIGVNAFIPLFTFVLGQSNEITDSISALIRTIFDFLHVPFVPKYLLIFIVVLFIAKAGVGLLLDYIRVRINADYEAKTREGLFSAQLRSSWPHLIKQRIGHLETLILVDVPASKEMLARITVSIMYLTSLIMYLVIVFNVSWIITLLTIAIGCLSFFVFKPIAYKVHALSMKRSRLQHETTHHVSEHLSGMKSVKTFGVEESAISRGKQMFRTLKQLTIRIDILRMIAVAIVPPAAVLYVAAIFALSFHFRIVTVAALPTIVYLIYRIFSYMQQLQDSMQLVNGALPYLRNIIEYQDRAHGRAEAAGGEKAFSMQKEISFNDVHFTYGTGAVLQGVSFSVPRGSAVGIIGPSGAGKTTCVDLLLRLLEPSSGTITVDGVDSKDISLAEWRKYIGYVPQEPFLIHDTIRNNVTFYDDSISEEAVWEAIRLAHLEDVVRSRPEGLDTIVGERGIELSAGQRQRLTIARALARKPEVLILDEATSALDTESETEIQKTLSGLKGRVIVIAIAHRLSTVLHSDKLIVLDEGKVMEEGAPRKLLEDTDSYFYKVSNITT